MYARTTSMTVSPSAVDAGIADVRDKTWPAVRDLEGCLGLSMLVDRYWRLPLRKSGLGGWGTRLHETGRLVVSTAWESEEALRGSREKVLPLRTKANEAASSATPVVDEWEIASIHQARATHPGTPVRTASARVHPANLTRALDYYHSTLVPQLEKLEGFASVSLLLNRSTGASVLSVAFDTHDTLEAAREQTDYLRTKGSQEVDVEFLDFAEFELVLSYFRTPERL